MRGGRQTPYTFDDAPVPKTTLCPSYLSSLQGNYGGQPPPEAARIAGISHPPMSHLRFSKGAVEKGCCGSHGRRIGSGLQRWNLQSSFLNMSKPWRGPSPP